MTWMRLQKIGAGGKIRLIMCPLSFSIVSFVTDQSVCKPNDVPLYPSLHVWCADFEKYQRKWEMHWQTMTLTIITYLIRVIILVLIIRMPFAIHNRHNVNLYHDVWYPMRQHREVHRFSLVSVCDYLDEGIVWCIVHHSILKSYLLLTINNGNSGFKIEKYME